MRQFVMRPLFNLADTQGATLLELLIALIIMPLIVLLVFGAYSSAAMMLGRSSRDWESQAIARSSLQVLARDLRQATYVEVADAAQIGFYADLDNDGVEEAVVFRFNDPLDRIERGINAVDLNADGRADALPVVLGAFIPSVVSPAGTFLTYYDAWGLPLTPGSPGWPATIRGVGFEVKVDINPSDSQPASLYRSAVQLRTVNFKGR
jgi:hypothetical protein